MKRFRKLCVLVRSNRYILVIWVICFGSAVPFVSGVIRYWDCTRWPSVPAFHVEEHAASAPIASFMTSDGHFSSAGDWQTKWTEFDYEIDGRVYHGTRGTPNGAPARLDFLPSPPLTSHDAEGNEFTILTPGPYRFATPPRAYYDPKRPGIAVLKPGLYQPTWLFFVTATTGLIGLVHLCLTLRPLR